MTHLRAMAHLWGRSLGVGLVGIGALACGGVPNVAPPLPSDGPGPGEVFQGTQCSAVRPQTEPDLMGWDSGSRANLHGLRQSGVVVVRYVSQGCNVELEVLSNCIGNGSYTFSYYPESRSKTLKSTRELFAEIPLSASRLSGNLKGNRALRADYELIGTAALPAGSVFRRDQIKGPPGECAKATHVVSKLYLGGFAMVAGEESSLEAKGKVFGASAGDSEGTSMERIDNAGDAKACEEAKKTRKETEGCQVPLRIGLLPLEDAATQAPRPPVATTPAAPSPPAPMPVVATRPAEAFAPFGAAATGPAEPKPDKSADLGGGGGREFDRGAAVTALSAAATSAKKCKKADGPTGAGKVKVTFAPSGAITSATVEGGPFAGTSVGGCIVGAFRGARVPAFDGAAVTVTKSFSID